MSRNDNFEYGHKTSRMFSPYTPLFHGTNQEFQPGDVIEPQSKSFAHSTPHLDTARVFGTRVYEVESINPDSDWDRQMKHTGNETHYERLNDKGFRVVAPVPKSRKAKHYEDRYREAAAQWSQETGAAFCPSCRGMHEPDDHRQ